MTAPPDSAQRSREEIVAENQDLAEGKIFAPAAYPGAAIVGAVLGLLLIGLACIGIRDLIVRVGWLDGSSWTQNSAAWIAERTWQTWMWPVAVILVLLGLWLLWLAVKPRRRTHVQLGDYQVMWTRRGDVARRASAALLTVTGVDHATTVVGRRRAKVTVTVSGEVDKTLLHDRATEAISPLKHPPRVKIRRVVRSREVRS
ncbi:DUF6286 domain-containing protein [Gordonia sp. DT219]|uniref:DUF6286 domain-containing protein n=1 Tax=Gordonia sp. DT219 TaxID=3416658 RepID=UPI003CEA8EE9